MNHWLKGIQTLILFILVTFVSLWPNSGKNHLKKEILIFNSKFFKVFILSLLLLLQQNILRAENWQGKMESQGSFNCSKMHYSFSVFKRCTVNSEVKYICLNISEYSGLQIITVSAVLINHNQLFCICIDFFNFSILSLVKQVYQNTYLYIFLT